MPPGAGLERDEPRGGADRYRERAADRLAARVGGPDRHHHDPEPSISDSTPPACEQIYGIGELNFPPRISEGCTITLTVHGGALSCVNQQIAISATGPGVSGITGHALYGQEDATGCVDVDDEDFTMTRVP